MPNAKVLSEKKRIVEELSEKLKRQSGVLVDYKGITVNEDTEMRVKLREANVDYTVVKNTLMRFAVKNVGFEGLEPILTGTTSLAVCGDDPIAPARILKEYADKLTNRFEIKAGFLDGRVLSAGEVNALAGIPALPVLQAQLLGTMLAPITSLAVVLKAIAEKDGASANESDDAAEQPAIKEPAPAETAAQEPAAKEPAPAETTAKEPAAKEPAQAETAAQESAAE